MTYEYEIRCCCDPSILHGTVLLDYELTPLHCKATLVFPVNGRKKIALQAEWFYDRTTGKQGMAIKSMDHPIEVLRQIPGFKESSQSKARIED